MKHPKLDGISEKFKSGEDFTLSRSQYIAMTGADIPQGKYYTEKQSAVAKRANLYGYRIIVVPEVLEFIKKKEK